MSEKEREYKIPCGVLVAIILLLGLIVSPALSWWAHWLDVCEFKACPFEHEEAR